MKRLFITILLALSLGLSAAAVAEVRAPIIQLSKKSATMSAGQTLQLKAKTALSEVRWSSENEQVAVVDDKGLITALKPGRAVIRATAGLGSAACVITVKAVPVNSILLSEKAIYISPGDTFEMEATCRPANAFDKTVSWTSLGEPIARIDAQTGLVTGVAVGVTKVKAVAHNGKTAFCTVYVEDVVHARSVVMSRASATLSYGRTLQLSARVAPVTAIEEDKVLTWSSSDSRVATVDQDGLVTAGQLSGSTAITARAANGQVGLCRLQVKVIPVKSLSLSAKTLTMEPGDRKSLTATILPSNATKDVPTWLTSNEAVASVSGGVITAHKSGTATITAVAGAKRAKCVVTVRSGKTASVTITAVGDITIGGDPRKPASSPASKTYYERLYGKINGQFLRGVQNYFKGDNEITLVNLESNFTTSTKYRNKSYVFKANPAYAHILSDAGVDVVGHANNHSEDCANSVKNTFAVVNKHNMKYIGNGYTNAVTRDGVKVGFCAFFAGTTSAATVRNVVSRMNKSCDLVVVSMHWGSEYVYNASASQRSLGKTAILAGADLVVGHHSHVVSGIEAYKGKYIVYSLGTFSSAIKTPDDMRTLIFKQTFEVEPGSGKVGGSTVKLIPCSMSSNANVNNAQPEVLSGSARKNLLARIKSLSQAFPATLPNACFE